MIKRLSTCSQAELGNTYPGCSASLPNRTQYCSQAEPRSEGKGGLGKFRALSLCLLLILTLLLSACGRNMYDQAKYEVYEPSYLLSQGTSAQPLLENTVPRNIALSDNRYDDPSFYTGLDDSVYVKELPLPLTEDLLRRGQSRFNIYCSPCHNYSGNGRGMIVQKGFPQPTSFHDERLRSAELGYFVSAMANPNGFGRMYSYSARVPPEDRWAIAAYIKTLQYSQYALPEDAPQDKNTEGASH